MKVSDNEITIRPFTLDDADAHLSGDDIEQAKWMGGKSTKESIAKWIKRNQENWKNNGPIYNFAIVKNDEDTLIGMVEANIDSKDLDGVNEGEANISYSIYPNFRGNGYAGKAILLLESFLKQKSVKTGVIRISPENVASLKVPGKLGYRNTGEITTKDGDKLIIFKKSLRN